MTFKSKVAGKEEGPFSTFSEAFTIFWIRFTAFIDEGPAEQYLNTCWIEGTFDDGNRTPLFWEAAKNFAYEVGLLVGEGELQEPAPEVNPSEVEFVFMQASLRATDLISGEIVAAVGDLVAFVED